MTFLQCKNYEKHCKLLEATFEISLFFKVRGQLSPYFQCFEYFSHDQQMRPSQNVYGVVTIVASSFVSFFNLLFSKYENSSHILAYSKPNSKT